MRSHFFLFSSVPPWLSGESLAQQRATIDSWYAAGFTPVTVNGPSEKAAVAALGLNIEIVTLPSDGKPRIGHILNEIKSRGCIHGAIINSDCRFIDYPNIADKLAAALDGNVLYAQRIDVHDEGSLACRCQGFDAFFFDNKLFDSVDDSYFCLGETWWDYWFPLYLAAFGARLGCLQFPLILHQAHETRWSEAKYSENGSRFLSELRSLDFDNASLDYRERLVAFRNMAAENTSQIGRVALECFLLLDGARVESEPLFIPECDSNLSDFLLGSYQNLLRDQRDFVVSKLNRLNSRIESKRSILDKVAHMPRDVSRHLRKILHD